MKHERVGALALDRGDRGAALLERGPAMDIGSIVLAPGDEVPNHYHTRVVEAFFTIDGAVTLWLNGTDRLDLGPGDYVSCEPYEMTYFVCPGPASWRALFVKAPHGPDDAVPRPWRPGEPAPSPPRRPPQTTPAR
jgi:quercetin dioxygenase-like cupin family protein